MKKLGYLLGLFFVAGFLFSSCSDDEDTTPQELKPTITFQTGTGYTYSDETINIGDSILVGVVCTANSNSNAKLTNFKIYFIENNITIPTSVNETLNDPSYTGSWYIPFDEAFDGKLYAEVTDKDGQKNSVSFNITVESATNPLDAEADFTWQRVGGTPATGLAPFGLKWTSNGQKVSAKIMKDTAEKFVELTSAQWTSIETKEDLAAAVEAATAITEYTGISADASNTYDEVLATKYNGEYFIIHITEATVVVGGSGTTITITGKYKK